MTEDDRKMLPSASSADRWMRCSASFLLEVGIVDKGGAASKRGDKIHAVLEGKTPLESLSYSDAIVAERIAFYEAREVERFNMEGAEQTREQRIFLLDDDGSEVCSAKSDVIFKSGGRALVINYKTGWYAANEPEDNMQMLVEAVCAFRDDPTLHTIRAMIIQPSQKGNETPYKDYSFEELKSKSEEVSFAAKAAIRGEGFNAGMLQCKWCKAAKAGICKYAYKERVIYER